MTLNVEITSPIDNSIYATRALLPDDEVSKYLAQARTASREWRNTPIETRAAICTSAIEALQSMQDEIAPELAWQMGRPVQYAGGELRGVSERATYMIAIAQEALKDSQTSSKPGFERYIQHVPLGVVLVVAPWNYPFLTAVNTIIPALMAGNSVILKHASQTLLVGERFAKAFEIAGLAKGVFQNLVLTHKQVSNALAANLVDLVNFTGSVSGGRQIESSLAGTFTNAGFELGGKDPAYVRSDCDLKFAIANIVDGAFFNSGQSCCGIERVYVDKGLFDDFISGAVTLTNGYVLGNPLNQSTSLGPMVSTGAANVVRSQIEQAISSGATRLIDPALFEASRANTPYLAPQILINVDHSMAVMRQESFGPVVGVMAVDSDEQAIELMNDSDFGLSASIWTGDIEAAKSIGSRLETGTVFMNRADYLDPELAWTGVKETGRGITLSKLAYQHLTRAKSFHLRHTIS